MSGFPWAGKSQITRTAIWRWQLGVAVAVLVVGVACSSMVFVVLQQQEHDRIQGDFEHASQERPDAARTTWHAGAGAAAGLLLTGLFAAYLIGIANWNTELHRLPRN